MANTFKGIYNSWDFAYGQNPAAGGALQVISGSTASGTYTITCSPAYPYSADGKQIILNTTTPITIGGDSAQETVTPTAVSYNALGQVLITAAFAFAHGTGAQVSSGSAGIVEAIIYAGANGGGLVAVTPQSTAALGGVTAMRTALLTYHGLADVTVLDYSGVSNTTTPAHSYYAAPITAPVNGGLLLSSGVTIY